jgi:hypothetical protein
MELVFKYRLPVVAGMPKAQLVARAGVMTL